VRIAFLCPTFDPGRCGVGDYVGRFVAELALRQHECRIVALADRYAKRISASTDSGSGSRVVRIPVADWNAGNVGEAERAIQDFLPDWVSLQMVCHGYSEKGLLVAAPGRLDRIATSGRRHLMFHEGWVGAWDGARARERLVGAAQRLLVQRMARRWRAEVVHTSNPAYQEQLARAGIASELLPLPNNIPVADRGSRAECRARLLRRAGLTNSGVDPFLAVAFGAVHRGWVDPAAINDLAAAVRRSGRPFVLGRFGTCDGNGQRLWDSLRQAISPDIPCFDLGALSAAEVSEVLQAADLGLSTSAWRVVGKSAAVAAMIGHGLPVLVTWTDWRLRGGETPEPVADPLLHRLDVNFLLRLAAGTIARGDPPPVGRSVEAYLASLSSAPRHPAAGLSGARLAGGVR
jgi:glycosyltransferase involved in cell wall biosynthesis